MKILFAPQAWEDYLYWRSTDKKVLKRVNLLIKDISRDPYEGIGKPEPLKNTLSGYWSRRIKDEDQIVYRVENDILKIAQARYHNE